MHPFASGHRTQIMAVQHARHENLRTLLAELEEAGIVGWEAQAAWMERAVTARRLQVMAEGGHIGVLFAEHVEYLLQKPRRWMDEIHRDEVVWIDFA